MFTKADYDFLHSLVFQPDYPGYKPQVAEIPNGDGKVDYTKRYAHIGIKDLATYDRRNELLPYLERGHQKAIEVATAIGLPREFMPRLQYGALRVLEYPPGTEGHQHKDFDLFTLMLYRDQPDKFVSEEVDLPAMMQLDPMAHLGEIGEIIGLGPATAHAVLPSETTQHSIVYFAIPDHRSVLSNGVTVEAFLDERIARSRKAVQ